MSNKIHIRNGYLEVNLVGSIRLDERLSQLSKIISVVSKTKSKYLLIKMLPESSLNTKEDIDKLLSKFHQEEFMTSILHQASSH